MEDFGTWLYSTLQGRWFGLSGDLAAMFPWEELFQWVKIHLTELDGFKDCTTHLK